MVMIKWLKLRLMLCTINHLFIIKIRIQRMRS
jgi:hypothetical protein